jgi:hypothetical protein
VQAGICVDIRLTSQQALDSVHELLGMVGLGQELIGLFGRIAVDIFTHCAANQEDFLLGLNLAAGFDEVHAVHRVHRIIRNEKDRKRLGGLEGFEGGSSVTETFDRVTERLKNDGSELEQHWLIIHDIDEPGVVLRFGPGAIFPLVHVGALAEVNTRAQEVASVQNERGQNIEYQTEKPETRMSKPETNSKSENSKRIKNYLNSKVTRFIVSVSATFEFISSFEFRISFSLMPV